MTRLDYCGGTGPFVFSPVTTSGAACCCVLCCAYSLRMCGYGHLSERASCFDGVRRLSGSYPGDGSIILQQGGARSLSDLA